MRFAAEVRLTYACPVPSVTAKKKCCKDTPRCRKCPVVLKRLTEGGYAERESRRNYEIDKKVPKKVLRLARTR
jgi:hypothetical protein